MTRRTLKIHGETYRTLKELKRDSETWDDLLQRLAAEDNAAIRQVVREELERALENSNKD